MATCSSSALLAEAATNGFLAVAQNTDLSNALTLQMLKNAGSGTETFGQLLTQACDNRFTCISQSPNLANAVALQLLCNLTDG